MENCEPLAWYGALVLLVTGGLIVIPYWRRKGELISGWNILLLGIAIFVGIGCFEAAVSPMRFHGVEWFQPTKQEVNWYVAATTIFLVTLLVTYYYDPISRALVARSLNKWPPISTSLLVSALILCLVLAVAPRIPALTRIIFIGAVLVNVSHKAMVFGCLFSFVLWYRNRLNLVWLGTFIAVFLGMCFLAILAGGGRRLLLSVFTTPVLVVYFYHARHWRPTKAMVVMALGVLGIFVVSLMYSTIRHFDRRGGRTERSAARAIEAVQSLGSRKWFDRFADDVLWNLSQQVVPYALLTDRFVATGQLEPQPLNTFKFFAVYPIPRRIWPDKPRSLGRVITHKMLGRETTWGTGIAGHAAYEGGLIVAAMFGYFAAFGIRFFVDPLQRQPTNPFLIAMLAAAAPHLIAWPRGDLSVMTFDVAECVFFAIALGIACRFVFGTERVALSARGAISRVPFAYQTPAR